MENAIVKERIMALVDSMLESRSQSDAWLFPSDWISDGYSLGDYHTGSNILAWYVLQSFSRILGEVYGEREKARELAEIAEKVRKDLDRLAIVQGPFGPQYIEGVNKDGKAPCLGHDGEESDTTLAPLYGLYGYDSLPFKNYTRFALSSHNAFYVPETRGLRWHTDRKTDSSFPGYITGFANVVDEESMNGENGYLTEIRKLTDVDGSIWWWPYPKGAKYGEVERCFHCGKSGWASGVFVSLFISEILGVKFDACSKVLSLRPFSPSSSFTWEGCRFGSFLFNLSYERKDDAVRVDVENLNPMEVHLKLEVILPDQRAGSTVFIDGTEAKKSVPCGTFLGRPVVVIENGLKERESRDFEIRFSEASTV
jgi:hypothetical protein